MIGGVGKEYHSTMDAHKMDLTQSIRKSTRMHARLNYRYSCTVDPSLTQEQIMVRKTVETQCKIEQPTTRWLVRAIGFPVVLRRDWFTLSVNATKRSTQDQPICKYKTSLFLELMLSQFDWASICCCCQSCIQELYWTFKKSTVVPNPRSWYQLYNHLRDRLWQPAHDLKY